MEEMLDKVIGVEGTHERDAYDTEVNSFLIGESIKQAKQSKNLTFFKDIQGNEYPRSFRNRGFE